MKCPYAVDRTIVTQCTIEYDDESDKQTSWTEVQNQKVQFSDCFHESCGAYRDGRCHYKD